MNTAATICLALAAGCMTIDWWAVTTARDRVEAFAKPAVMVLLIAVALLGDLDPASLRAWIVAGLVCGLAGDVALLPGQDRFVLGLTAFLVGHLAYAVAFVQIWSPTAWLAVGLVGVVGLVAGFGLPIERSLRGRRLRVPVVAYSAVTVAVLITGAGTGRVPIALGTLSFAASDGLLGADRFVSPARSRRVWIHVLYQLGQVGIVLGSTTAFS